jgi:YVTN family beta-propeller protein
MQSSRRPRPSVLSFRHSISIAASALALLSVAGCGASYRPVVTAINTTGPAGQPSKIAVAISDPNLGNASGTLPGLVTFVDFSGDTVLITADLGVRPQYLILGSGGGTGYTINGDGTVNSFSISPSLLSSAVQQTTLLPSTNPALPLATSIFPEGNYTYIVQPGRASVAEFSGSPLALQQELAPVGPLPTYIAGVASAPRIYTLSASSPAGSAGTATGIEALNTVDNPLPVGVNPVYGVMTADGRRVFVMNQGSNSVSVIDAQNNQLDPGVSSGTAGLIQDPAAVSPLWADFAPTLSEVLVANAGSGTSNGSVSIFSIPLCSATAVSNPNCNPANPVDAVGFGSLVANVPVGKNPIMIAVLQDGTQAYVINQADSTVSVINLRTNTVTATIPVPATPNPTFIAVTTGTPTGKVYVTSSTSKKMTVIRTDINQVNTTIDLQGFGMQVRMTAP